MTANILHTINIIATLGILVALVVLADRMTTITDTVRMMTREIGRCSALQKAEERRADTKRRLPGAMAMTDVEMEYSVDRT